MKLNEITKGDFLASLKDPVLLSANKVRDVIAREYEGAASITLERSLTREHAFYIRLHFLNPKARRVERAQGISRLLDQLAVTDSKVTPLWKDIKAIAYGGFESHSNSHVIELLVRTK